MSIIKTKIFTANEGDPSVGNAGPDAIETDLNNLFNNSEQLEDIAENLQVEINNLVAGGTIPLDHSSADTLYGLGSKTKYGHVKVIDDFTKEEYADGEALSAYQGFNLNNEKAPNNHASANNTYGLGTPTEYGHTKVINDLTKNAYANGEALSAYQGKVLSDSILAPKGSLKYTGVITSGTPETDLFSFDITKYTNIVWSAVGRAFLQIFKNENSYIISGSQVISYDRVYTTILTINSTSNQIIDHYGVRSYFKIRISGTTCTISSVGESSSNQSYTIYLF